MGRIVAYCIAGHHSGLKNAVRPSNRANCITPASALTLSVFLTPMELRHGHIRCRIGGRRAAGHVRPA
jgi:hypothetical protein